MSFAHLHVHTEFSLLDGSNKIKEYVSRVKELGMNSAAITDHGVMYGVIDFYREAKKQGINPILGCEVYVAPNSRFDREITGGDDRYYHLVLLAENEEGYANLTKIVSKGFVEGYYYKPRVDKELLRKYHKGIIALSACLAGEVARFLTKGLYEEAKKTALEYQEIFGEGNFFLEYSGFGGDDAMLPGLITEGVHKRGLPLTRLAALTAGNAAKIMGLAPKKGSLMPGRDADIVVVDMDEEWVFDGTKSLSKTKSVHNIYHGSHMKGRVKQTWVRGKLVYKDGTIMADDGYGIYIPKQKKTGGAE